MYEFDDIYKYSKDLHVLFVEDDTNLLAETSDLLEDYFGTLVSAPNGEVALEIYLKHKQESKQYFDLIITDINMPKKDGLELISDIKKHHRDQEIVVLSAYNESSRLLDLIHLGINNFIMKPIEMKQFSSIIYSACKNIYYTKQHSQFILSQAKLASMGKMIDSIAHQWLQPINIIKIQSAALEIKNQLSNLNKEDIEQFIQDQNEQTEHIIETLQEFRSFFRPKHALETTLYKYHVRSVLLLLKESLEKNSIKIEINLDEEHNIQLISNEFKHVIINIINNSIDAFNDRNIQDQDRVLKFGTYKEDNNVILTIEDTAGGIENSILNDIFNSNFTTKEDGTGMGLYMSSQIIEKIGGTLSASNKNRGSCFKISLKSHTN